MIRPRVPFLRSASVASLALAALAGLAVPAALAPSPARAEIRDVKPEAGDISAGSFPALGASAPRKVAVEWNQFHDHAAIGSILRRLHDAFPDLTRLYSIGKSVEGRELWTLEVTAFNKGDAARKPAMYIDGNIHGNEVQASEVALYTAWYALHEYGQNQKVTELLDRVVFYLVPTINPDGRDHWLHDPQTPHTSRTGARPFDNDNDGAVDEDGLDDLDGDGQITMMRIRDPHGRYKRDPKYPDILMVPAEPDEPGEFTLLGDEGIDNDGDGEVNEDPPGGYDTNRNWPYDWAPNYIQYGAQDYPLSLPEPRAVAEFALARRNIAAMQSYHNFGGMILRAPGREGGVKRPADDRVMSFIADRGVAMIPFYKSMVIYKDLYTVWGGEVDWFYGGLGVLSFTNELWTGRNLFRSDEPDDQKEMFFQKYVLLNDGVAPWHEFDHPTYGKIEIGGFKKEWSRTPPSFLLEEECHRNMVFTFYHADQMPLVDVSDVEVKPMGGGLSRVRITVENRRLMPTRAAQDVENHINAPDAVTLEGAGVEVVSSGRVTDRFFNRIEPTRRRPSRVEIETIPGMAAERVEFVVRGSGPFTATLDSVKGGVVKREGTL